MDKLFIPLKMVTATFGLAALEKNPNHALPHIWRKGQWMPTKVDPNYYSLAPAAGVNASIQDMAQWMLAQLGQRQEVLSESMLNDLQAKVIKTSVARSHYGLRSNLISTYYGLGWRVFDFGAHKNFVHHGGWVQGYRTEMVFNRELQIGMVFLTNAETKLARDVTSKFVNLYENSQHLYQAPELLRADARIH
jgi:beta-lactamase class C